MLIAIFAVGVVALAAGIGAGYVIRKQVAAAKVASAEARVGSIINDAKSKAQATELEAKQKAIKILDEAKHEEIERRKELSSTQARLEKRETLFDKQLLELKEKNDRLNDKSKAIDTTKEEIEKIKVEAVDRLQKVAELTKDEAKDQLLKAVEADAQDEAMARIHKVERLGDEEYEVKARNVLATVISRIAASHCAETTTTQVQLPNDEMKGRIIGKEGRNIKSLEQLTGTEIIVDDTPNIITVSGFSPIRRQVARLALEKLIQDGRIHPTKIEDAIDQAKKDLALDIKKAGEDALYECGISIASIDPKLISILGRLKYRSSYGQNVLRHSIEVALISGFLGKELGADAAQLVKGGLFHDIGKAVDHDVPGGHPEIGYNILKKFGFPEDAAYHTLSHHEDRPKNIEGYICKAADAISGARPGARKDTLENYVQRLEELEKVATSFPGVAHAYAIQAGREVRVFVSPNILDDLGAWNLAKDIAKKCEQELQYPGEIKINVIRETRAIEYAR
jgi:ribonuclease Y